MASPKCTIKIKDEFSPAIKEITKNLEKIAALFEENKKLLERAIRFSVETV